MNTTTRVSSRGRVSKFTLRQQELEFSSSDSDNESSCSDDCYQASRSRKHKHRNRDSPSQKTRTLHRWTPEQHQLLERLVAQYGTDKKWAEIAAYIPGRSGKQCRERWLNHLREGLIKGRWTVEEEFILGLCHALLGSHWSQMVRRLPGRCENSIKNFWNATLRSKPTSKKRGLLWAYMQNRDCSQPEQDRGAFVNAVESLRGSDFLPPFVHTLHEGGRLNQNDWDQVFEAEAAFLAGTSSSLPDLCVPCVIHTSQVQESSGLGAARPGSGVSSSISEGGQDSGAAPLQDQGSVQCKQEPPAVLEAPAVVVAAPARRRVQRRWPAQEDLAADEGQVRLPVQRLCSEAEVPGGCEGAEVAAKQVPGYTTSPQQCLWQASAETQGHQHPIYGSSKPAEQPEAAAAAAVATSHGMHGLLRSPDLYPFNSCSMPVGMAPAHHLYSSSAVHQPQHLAQHLARGPSSSSSFGSSSDLLQLPQGSNLASFSNTSSQMMLAAAGGEVHPPPSGPAGFCFDKCMVPPCDAAAAAADDPSLLDAVLQVLSPASFPQPNPATMPGDANGVLLGPSGGMAPAAAPCVVPQNGYHNTSSSYQVTAAGVQQDEGNHTKRRRISLSQLGYPSDRWYGQAPGQAVLPLSPSGLFSLASMHCQQPQQPQQQHQQQHPHQGPGSRLLPLQLGRQESCDLFDQVEALMSPGWEQRLLGAGYH